ncbi:hypothetical protein HWV62_7238 [Athelia sp. TMB]|nr:hypothetical protein HWV62_7238 [Athelia sp. TMB]
MDSPTPLPLADSAPPPTAEPSSAGSPTAFLKGVVGKEVVVRLVSGVDYRGAHPSAFFFPQRSLIRVSISGVLACLDGYMNIALERAEEVVRGRATSRFGDAFIRGNNGAFRGLVNGHGVRVLIWFGFSAVYFSGRGAVDAPGVAG